jgi:hypothetical protein
MLAPGSTHQGRFPRLVPLSLPPGGSPSPRGRERRLRGEPATG